MFQFNDPGHGGPIRALHSNVDVLLRQRIRDEDKLTAHIQHEHDRFRDLVRAVEAGPQDGPKDASRVVDALAEIKANRTSRNGDDNHDSGTGSRRTERAAREMFPEESDEVEKYLDGIPDMIQESVMASKPKKMQDAIEFATELMDQKIHTLAERPREKKPSQPAAANNQRAQGENQRVLTCFECGAQGHFKSNFPKLKNKNQVNQAGNGNAVARAYGVGTAGINSNSNVVTYTSLIDIIPTTLDHGYDIELVDDKVIWFNTLIRDCTLNFLNHPFSIDLMPVEIGSFDVIIGMDWLLKYHVVMICDEKIVRIPFGDEILIVRDKGSNNEHVSRLNIISCTKTQKYLLKGCQVFLAHVTAKKAEDNIGAESNEYHINKY
ncbi:putative reverse transcriptase domain-containing protein [Tanacetum coccineum]